MIDLLLFLLENEFVLSAIAIGLVWLIRRFQMPVDGLAAVWLTASVCLALGALKAVLTGAAFAAFPSFPSAIPWADPFMALEVLLAFAFAVLDWAKSILASSGAIFLIAKAYYKAIKAKMLGAAVAKAI